MMTYLRTKIGVLVLFSCTVTIVSLRLLPAAAAEAQMQMKLRADLKDAPRHLLHITEQLPVHPGTNTFSYPKWIPGYHLPGGPIDNLTGLVFHAGGLDGPVLTWRRDLVDLYSFHVIAPDNINTLSVEFDVLDVSSRANTTATKHTSSHVAMLEPAEIVLYPTGIPVRDISIQATIHLPAGWSAATALRTANNVGASLDGPDTTFTKASLERFVDSAIVAGDHCRQYPLAPEIKPQHTLTVCAESDAALDLPPELLAHMSALVRQTTLLFHSHHYKHYDFLVALSPHLDGDSLEHTQSADYVVKSHDLKDAVTTDFGAYLFPHEYVHAWCGKYRRPARMATPDYSTPQQDDLLWIYEGLTEYYGDVLASRAGFRTPTQTIEQFDYAIYTIDQPGREWRPLQDTADAAPILRGSDQAWGNWRRDQDFYKEGAQRWLEADMKIRSLTNGRKSLDDFAALFFGANPSGIPDDGGPDVVPYEFNDVVLALNQIAPYSWAAFWTKYLNALTVKPPTVGLDEAGYSYTEAEAMSPAEATFIQSSHMSDMFHSLGFFVLPDGTLRDVWMHSPAFMAGLGPGDKLTAVNSQPYSPEVLARAVRQARGSSTPIVLTATRDDESATYRVDYHEGEKYALLQRNTKPDTLTTKILEPLQ